MASVCSDNGSSLYSKSSKSRISSSEIDDNVVNLQTEYTTILNELREGKPFKKLNILIVGMPESGKSSLINSLIMAINVDGYKEVAGGSSQTLKGYHVVQALAKKPSNYICNPCILECPGFANTDDDNITLILRQIINGQISEGQDIEALLSKSSKQLTVKKGKKPVIDVIIVTQSAEEDVAEHLYECVVEAAQEHDIPVFCVMTKKDLAEEQSRENCKKFARCFAIQGQSDKVACCRLYPVDDDNTYRISSIDREMCKIWTAISQSKEYRQLTKRTSSLRSLLRRK